ncbi:MAG: DUF493 domain-containing protein [Myxococcales bacterium FL481]|nr:MAG: DUF493 domain-containing protein [Myxococcales bacterium FL481]
MRCPPRSTPIASDRRTRPTRRPSTPRTRRCDTGTDRANGEGEERSASVQLDGQHRYRCCGSLKMVWKGPVSSVRHAPPRELLLATHQFPGPYCIKAFGPGDDAFRSAVESAAESVVTRARFESRVRVTSSGARSCVTLDLRIDEVDEIIAVYERLYALPQLALIL